MRERFWTNVVGMSFALSPSSMRAQLQRQRRPGYGSGTRIPDRRRDQFADIDASLGGSRAKPYGDINVPLEPYESLAVSQKGGHPGPSSAPDGDSPSGDSPTENLTGSPMGAHAQLEKTVRFK
mmetsp:Transcript_29084/g.72515  ORF Transcript_29084/g.72515 Transcript_29084/m.72515 type:complete len:123 (-) Transcript_29084:169-537(-)